MSASLTAPWPPGRSWDPASSSPPSPSAGWSARGARALRMAVPGGPGGPGWWRRSDGAERRAGRSGRQIEDEHDRHAPKRNGEQQRPVRQQVLGRVPPEVAAVEEVEVSKDAVEDERQGEGEPGGPEL